MRIMNTTYLSDLAEDYVAELPAVLSRESVSTLGITVPMVWRFRCDEIGYSAYRYLATIRELTRD